MAVPPTAPSIPLISLAPYLDNSAPGAVIAAVRAAVRAACTDYGFFQLADHGIPLALQTAALECTARFFALPLAEKRALAIDGPSGRGYERVGGQTLQAGGVPDLKEGFYIGDEIPATSPLAGTFLHGPNHWPASLPAADFRTPLMEYRAALLTVATTLMRILAAGLPYGDSVFDDFTRAPVVANLKLLHYPAPPPDDDDAGRLGAGAHTDFGALTLLLQDPSAPGLEVAHPTAPNVWIPVPARPDVFVVNVGDLLAAWTAGVYRSAVHRVRNRTGGERYSVPFFFHGNMGARVGVLGGKEGEDEGEGRTVGEHIRGRFRGVDNHAAHRE